nr:hypothetical protein [Thiomonas sp.]
MHTVRRLNARIVKDFGGQLVRINPEEWVVEPHHGVGACGGALEAWWRSTRRGLGYSMSDLLLDAGTQW